jgi:hypothetical protein
VLLLAVPIAALFLAGCGGDSASSKKTDADDWVTQVCDMAKDSGDKTDAIFEDYSDLDLSEDGAKDDLLDAYGKVLKEWESLLSDFNKDVGVPDIDKGKDVRAAFKTDLEENRDHLKTAISKIKKLDEGDDFEDDVNNVFDDIDDNDLRDSLDDLNESDVDDLVSSIDDDSDCSALLFDS